MFVSMPKTTLPAVLTLGLLASSAFAGDGVIEINMTAAEVGGITAGDAPGFPVTLSEGGSYRLTGNLSSSALNTTIVDVTASYVTLDLNGFHILGPDEHGSGEGIISSATESNVTVKNGGVYAMGSSGIRLASVSSTVENVDARGNGHIGISVGLYGVVRNCSASQNDTTGISASTAGRVISSTAIQNGSGSGTGTGIFISNGGSAIGNTSRGNVGEGIVSGRGATIVNNTLYENGEDGARTGEGCLVKQNTVRDNALFGLNLGSNTGYADNVITDNTSGSVSGGVQIGTNYCGTNTVCP